MRDATLHRGVDRRALRSPDPRRRRRARTSCRRSVPVELAIWGERAPGGTFDEARLATDLAAIVDDHVARFGEAPFDALHVHPDARRTTAYGGLEHRASSVNLYHPHFAATRKAYEGLLELLSHELFHAWNGKRIAPRAAARLRLHARGVHAVPVGDGGRHEPLRSVRAALERPDHREELPRQGARRLGAPAGDAGPRAPEPRAERRSTRGSSSTSPTSRTSTRPSATT